MEHQGKSAVDAVEQTTQPDLAEIGLQVADTVVKSGLLEHYGAELGISGAVIATIVGVYWKVRKKQDQEIASIPDEAESPQAEEETPSNEVEKADTNEKT